MFGVLAYDCYREEDEGWTVAYGALTIIFQPFVKIALGRGIWNVVDVAVAGLLLRTLWIDRYKRK